MSNADEYVRKIDEDGYVLIRNAVGQQVAQQYLHFAQTFQYSEEEEAAIAAKGQRLNGFSKNIFNVAMKKPDVLSIFIRGVQGEVLKKLLNDKYYKTIPEALPNYILRSLLLRSSLAAMPYHIDAFLPYGGSNTSVVQAALFLGHSHRDNGCTLLIPGSHKTGEYAPQGDNPCAVPLEAAPGDIALWDSRIWHATTENTSGRDRWALIATFCRWYIKQGFDYPRAIPPEVFERLDDDEKIVYGFCSTVPLNEFEKTELKTGLAGIQYRDRTT
jgi:ectoine hydroxylase-related dioxygenase (phytanoyl-CoA dioxygenase family)